MAALRQRNSLEDENVLLRKALMAIDITASDRLHTGLKLRDRLRTIQELLDACKATIKARRD